MRADARSARLGLACAAVALGFLLVELAARLALPAPDAAPVSDWPHGLVVPHPTRGYAWAADFAGSVEHGGRRIAVTTNSLGLRERPLDPATTPDPILAVGDSFTVGFGVAAEEAWPARLEQHLAAADGDGAGPRVVNGGVSGYSLAQIRATADELVPLLRPRLVVVGVYTSRYWRLWDPYVYFHGYTVLRHMLPRLRVGDSGRLRVASAKPRWRRLEQWLDDHSVVGARLFRALPVAWRGYEGGPPLPDTFRRAARPFLAELAQLREVARAHAAGLVVLLVNHQQPDGSFREIQKRYNQVVTRFCRARGIPVLDPIPIFERAQRGAVARFRLGDDHHWSPAAHDLVAAALADFLTANGLLDPRGAAEAERAAGRSRRLARPLAAKR